MGTAAPHVDFFPKPDFSAQFLPRGQDEPYFHSQPSRPKALSADVSVAGVVLLTAVAVVLAIMGAMLFGSLVLGAWWLIVHIPIPAPLLRLFVVLHIL